MMDRSFLIFVAALIFFACLEAWAGRRSDFSMPLWLGLLAVLATIAVSVGGALWLGSLTSALVLVAIGTVSEQADTLIIIASMIVGVWLATIAVQLTQNAVRFALGRKLEPMRWINNPTKWDD